MTVITKTSEETKKLGIEFGKKLLGGEVIALVGDLGAGKTTFVQGLAKGLGIKQRIISPTFIIVRQYSPSPAETTYERGGLSWLNFYHADLYRLEGNLEQEIKNLGLTYIWDKPENIVVIEWAEKIRNLLSENTIWVNFELLGENVRRIDTVGIWY